MKDEFGDDITVVSSVRLWLCTCVIKCTRTLQSGESTSGITGYFEVTVESELVHSKKVTEDFTNALFNLCGFVFLSRVVMATLILTQSLRRSRMPLLPN